MGSFFENLVALVMVPSAESRRCVEFPEENSKALRFQIGNGPFVFDLADLRVVFALFARSLETFQDVVDFQQLGLFIFRDEVWGTNDVLVLRSLLGALTAEMTFFLVFALPVEDLTFLLQAESSDLKVLPLFRCQIQRNIKLRKRCFKILHFFLFSLRPLRVQLLSAGAFVLIVRVKHPVTEGHRINESETQITT